MTLKEKMLVLGRQPRPLELRFLRHKEWERGPSGLPEIDFALAEEVFERHDRKDLGSLNGTQFAALMAEVHELSCIMLGREVDNSYYPLSLPSGSLMHMTRITTGFFPLASCGVGRPAGLNVRQRSVWP